MAWAFVAHRGSANAKASATTISVSPTAALAVDSIIIVRGCTDNGSGDVGGESNRHSVSDSKGNTWTKIREHNSGGGAASGVIGSLFISKITTQIETTDTVTLTIDIAVSARAVGLEEFSVAAGKTYSVIGVNGANGSSTAPTVTLSGLAAATHLFLGAVCIEGPNGDTFTQDADYADNTSFGTTGGGVTSNVAARFGDRIVSAASDTYNPTLGTARDWIDILAAVDEVDPPIGAPAGLFTKCLTGVGI